MFRGRFDHTIDTKGRVSVPSGFRVELERRSEHAPMVTQHFDCLRLYSHDDWSEEEQRIISKGNEDVDFLAYQRFVFSGVSECPIDKQGRILLPQRLREDAGLERDVTIVGVGSWIEIWDKAQFDADLLRTRARHKEISSTVASLKRKEF
jgi:MraZ protein